MAQGNIFDQFDPTPAGGPVYGPPPKKGPYDDEDQQLQRDAAARAAADQRRQEQKDAEDRRRYGEERGNKQFDSVGKLRDDFNQLPEVKSYRVAIQQADQALNTGDGPQADLALTYAFAKAMDPDSVVREAEQGMVTNSQPWFQAKVEEIRKQFGMDGAGSYTPEARQAIRQQIINSVASRRKLYGAKRGFFSDVASRYGFDPFEVVGTDDGAPFLAKFQEYDRRQDEDPEGLSYANAGGGQEGVVTDTSPSNLTDDDRASPLPNDLIARGKEVMTEAEAGRRYPIAAGIGDIVEGGLNAFPGIILNPANTALFRAAGYDGYTSDIGQTTRDLLGLPEGDPTIAAINQGTVAGLVTGGVAGAAGKLVAGRIGEALSRFGAAPLDDAITGAGAGAGSEYARSQGYGPVGQAVGAVVGGVSPTALRGASSALRRPSRPPIDLDESVVEAGERQGIPIRQPDARPSLRGDLATAEAKSYSGPLIARTRAKDEEVVQDRLQEVGGRGEPRDNYSLGQQMQALGVRYIDRTKGVKNGLYAEADKLADGQRVVPEDAIAALDQNIAELEAAGSNTNSTTIGFLRGLRDDLAKPEGFSVSEFQSLRSAASKKIKGDQALTSSDADRRLGNVIQAFNSDAEAQLPPAAVAALQQADGFYAERQQFIQGVLQNIMGSRGKPLSAENTANRILSMARNRSDYKRLSQILGEASPDEHADFAATLAEGLGRGRNGEFGMGALATNISKIPVNVRRVVFGEDGAKALEDLKVIARAKSDTGVGLNSSRSGVVMARQVGFRMLTAGLLGASTTGGSTTGALAMSAGVEVVTALGQARTARLLLNPKFTKWLKFAPNTTDPKRIDSYFNKLTAAAAKSPVFANDVQAFQDAIVTTLSKSPGRAAAEDETEARREPPEQYRP